MQLLARRSKRTQNKQEKKWEAKLSCKVDMGVVVLAMLSQDLGWMPQFVKENNLSDIEHDLTERVCSKSMHAHEEELSALLFSTQEDR